MFHTADEFAAKMTTPVILLCFFLAFCPLSVGTPLTCPPPFLNESPQQGSGKLCATLQLQTKLPCPGVNLSMSENVPLNPEKWHLESLSLKVEKSCSFMVFTQDQQSQHFPGGFYANIPINYKSEFLCICTKLHIRHRRTPTFNNFYLKHIVDGKNIPTDNNAYDRFWSKTFDNALKARNQYVPKQTFIPNNSFKQGFKINKDFKIKFSNQKILYRSENKMDMYDVTKRNGQVNVVKRIDYAVFDVNDEDQPIHFEPVPEEFSEPLGKMKPQQALSIKSKPGSGWRAGLQKWGEVVEEVAEAENVAMAVVVTSTLTQASIFTSIMSSLAFLFV